jgi:hypothetical protein
MIDYGKLAIGAFLLLISFSSGWYIRNLDYKAFRLEVENTAKAQEEKVKSIRSQQELVTKGIKDEYDSKLTTLRNYYKSTSVWNNGSGSQMSGISSAPSATDVISSYNQLAGACAETTLQLVQLQKWLNEQVGIK